MEDIVAFMKRALSPRGTSPIVEIGFLNGGLGGRTYYSKEFIDKALDCLGQRVMIAAAEIEPLNALEKLAIELLMSSMYAQTFEEVKERMKSAKAWDDKMLVQNNEPGIEQL